MADTAACFRESISRLKNNSASIPEKVGPRIGNTRQQCREVPQRNTQREQSRVLTGIRSPGSRSGSWDQNIPDIIQESIIQGDNVSARDLAVLSAN